MPSNLAGLGVDLAKVTFCELGHPNVVLRVRDDLVDRMPFLSQGLDRLESLPFSGREIEPIDVLRADTLGPHFAVDVVAQPDEVQLDAMVVIFGGQRVVLDLASPGIKISQRPLEHRVEPERAALVELE